MMDCPIWKGGLTMLLHWASGTVPDDKGFVG
jgi:hypothetical protein